MPLRNDYLQVIPVERSLYAVQLSDKGWSIADGPGTQMVSLRNLPSAGFHLPVKFASRQAAEQALRSGPTEHFSTARDSAWVQHCLATGGQYEANYAQRRSPDNTAQRSG